MADYHITCIRRDRMDPDRTIDGIGGPICGYLPMNEALRWIDAGHTFHTYFNGVRAEVFAVGTMLGGRYLTTSADGLLGNNLLHLEECPI